MRRRLPWLLALPLIAAGSLGAHALGALVVGTQAAEAAEAHDHVERSSAGLAGGSVLVLGVVVALGLGVVICGLLRVRGRRSRGAPPWLFFLLLPIAFAAQEVSERLLHAEAAPFAAVHEPQFVVGLLLQLPLGLLALLIARRLLRVVHAIARLLMRPPRVAPRTSAVARPVSIAGRPRVAALALGYPQRGPPLLP